MGWIKPRKPKEDTPTYYDLWAHEDPNSILGRHKMHVPAPKMKLPGHEESYNPPPEYLLSEEEVKGGPGAAEEGAGGTWGAVDALGPRQGCAEGGQPGVLGHQDENWAWSGQRGTLGVLVRGASWHTLSPELVLGENQAAKPNWERGGLCWRWKERCWGGGERRGVSWGSGAPARGRLVLGWGWDSAGAGAASGAVERPSPRC